MEVVKVTINLGGSSVAAEGPQEFVEKQVERYYRHLADRREDASEGATKERVDTGGGATEPEREKRVRVVPKPGASCIARVRQLVAEGYFSEARGAGEIQTYLKDTKSFTHDSSQVTAALSYLTKRGVLRRIKEGKSPYQYVNP